MSPDQREAYWKTGYQLASPSGCHGKCLLKTVSEIKNSQKKSKQEGLAVEKRKTISHKTPMDCSSHLCTLCAGTRGNGGKMGPGFREPTHSENWASPFLPTV